MEVQEYLKTHSIEDLCEKFAIKASFSQDGQLVILNYDQIDSPKMDSIVRECRSLCLETEHYEVVARSFFRFFNYEENKQEDKKFNWENLSVEEKCDGSLMTLYYWDGSWRVNTRSTFGNLEIADGVGKTWAEIFSSLINVDALDGLNKNLSYVFELCTKWNKVVKTYEKDTLFLLTSIHNRLGIEQSEILLDNLAQYLGCKRPERYNFTKISDVVEFVNKHPDPTFEGCILKDGNVRLKCKNPAYVALSHLKGNGNICSPAKLVELIFKGDIEETFIHFPEIASKAFPLVQIIEGEKAKAKTVYECAQHFKTQKEFAIFVNTHTKLYSFCFNARKHKVSFEEIWQKEAKDFWIKNIKDYLS